MKRLFLILSITRKNRFLSSLSQDIIKTTLQLPRTSLPTRSSPLVREPELTESLTSILYRRLQASPLSTKKSLFVLHDGPPYANGSLHMGHFLNKVLKDIANRSSILENYNILFVPGWDCHGMPIELKALSDLTRESTLKLNSEKSVKADKHGITLSALEIRKRARAFAEAAINSQRNDFVRWGILADWDLKNRHTTGSSYVTMDTSYESAQLRVFSKLVERGLVFRDLKPVYWSPSSSSALAEAELEYRDDHESDSIYVAFPFKSLPQKTATSSLLLSHEKSLYDCVSTLRPSVVTWTTTPWTLPANVALSVHPDIFYCIIRQKDVGVCYILAKERLESFSNLFGGIQNVSVELDDILGLSLLGLIFSHPISHFGERTSIIIPAHHVTADSGSGIVHTAPGHGVEDYEAVKLWNQNKSTTSTLLPLLCPVDDYGKFDINAGPLLVGKQIHLDGHLTIIELLKSAGTLVSGPKKHKHRYPYDWRTKKPVIIRATKQWFIRISEIMSQLLASSHQMHPPASYARFLGMLSARKHEWCISRQRSWGVPIPALYRSDTKEPFMTKESIEYIQHILEKNGGTDAWWTLSADEFLLPSKREEAIKLGLNYEKGFDTMDVWFDSGTSWSSAWANSSIPSIDSSTNTTSTFGRISDLVIEGSDQHRGWFQSSLITSIAATGQAPFKMILSHGFVLDQNLRKMSKSLGNVISPSDIISGTRSNKSDQVDNQSGKQSGKLISSTEQPLGADVLRYWVASSDYTADVSIGPKALTTASDALKKVRNTLRFILASLHDFKYFEEKDMINSITEDVLFAWQSPVMNILTIEYSSKTTSHIRLGLLERGLLYRLALFERHVRSNFVTFNYSGVISALNIFSAIDLSASFFDFSKDRLYCDESDDNVDTVVNKERAIRRQIIQAVLWETLRVLTRAIAPIAVFTSQDIFEHSAVFLSPKKNSATKKFPSEAATLFDAGPWNQLPSTWFDVKSGAKWANALSLRSYVNSVIEIARKNGEIGASTDVEVELYLSLTNSPLDLLITELEMDGSLTDLLLVSRATIVRTKHQGVFEETSLSTDLNNNKILAKEQVCIQLFEPSGQLEEQSKQMKVSETLFGPPSAGFLPMSNDEKVLIIIRKARGQKCIRCRIIQEEVSKNEAALCVRCDSIVQKKLALGK
jgi:isoleucyl-tRNA synthetase